ncbi:MAG: ATPase domain-containing protein [Polyangiales bacterium]
MANTETLSTGIAGLDLVLDGGLRGLRRLGDNVHSGVLLVRGGPGSGKTILGAHLAAALAIPGGLDIVWCCLELLPTELEAQLSSFTKTKDVQLHFAARAPEGSVRHPAGYVEMAAVPFGEGDHPEFIRQLEAMLDRAQAMRLSPRVLVIDSLSDGYGVGSHFDRFDADAVCKLAAARGIFVVLLEETSQPGPSPWSFAADTVLELATRTPTRPDFRHDRALWVTKHRFAMSDSGPHPLRYESGAVALDPRIEAWSRMLPTDEARRRWFGVPPDVKGPQWRSEIEALGDWPGPAGILAAAISRNADGAFQCARQLLAEASKYLEVRFEVHGQDLPSNALQSHIHATDHSFTIYTSTDLNSPERLLSDMLGVLRQFRANCLILGGFDRLQTADTRTTFLRILDVLLPFSRSLRWLVVLHGRVELSRTIQEMLSIPTEDFVSAAEIRFHASISRDERSRGHSQPKFTLNFLFDATRSRHAPLSIELASP